MIALTVSLFVSISVEAKAKTEPQVILNYGELAPFKGVLVEPDYFDYYQVRDMEAQIYQSRYNDLLSSVESSRPWLDYILIGAAAILVYEGSRTVFSKP